MGQHGKPIQSQESDTPKEAIPMPIEPITQYIWISAGISKKLEDTITQLVISQHQANVDVSEYVFYITSTGGDAFAGVNLYNFLKSLSVKTTAYNMGIVASAAVPFFLGCKTRIGVPNCSFMIHQTMLPRESFPANVNAFDLQTQLQLLGGLDKKTTSVILSETTAKAKQPLTSAKIDQAIERSMTYPAEEAIKHGFIEKIEQPEISRKNIFYITDEWLNKKN